VPAALAAGGRAWRLPLGWAEAGAHRVAVTLGGGGHVVGSPFTVCAEPDAACLAASAFEGAGLRQARQALPAGQGCRRRQMHVAHADGPVFPGFNFVTLLLIWQGPHARYAFVVRQSETLSGSSDPPESTCRLGVMRVLQASGTRSHACGHSHAAMA